MDSFSNAEPTRRRTRTALVLVTMALVVASVAVTPAAAATALTADSATDVEIGSTGQSQTVSFRIDLGSTETTTVTIDTSTALSGTDTSLASADSATTASTGISVGTPSTSGGDVQVTVSEDNGGADPATATVDVTLTLDTSGQSTEQSVTYTVSESTGGLSDIVTFDLVDTTAPTYDSATTGDSATGSSTARDRVTLSFTEAGTGIDAATVDASDFAVSGATVSGATVNGADEVVLTLDSNLATDATPTVDVVGSIADGAGNTLSTGSQTASDGLSPVQTGWAYDDGDGDGTVDLIRVDYSEDVGASTFESADWTVTTAGDPNVANPTTPTYVSATTRLYLNVSADADVTGTQTGSVSNPRVQYAGTSVVDAAGNEAPTQTEGYTDVADPVVKTVSSVDADGDGQVDRVDVTFTEQISAGQSSSASASDFTVGGADAGSVTKGSLTVPGDGPTVELAVTGPDADTALGLTLDYSASTLRRDGSNIAAQFSGETVTDGAAPVVTAATTLDRDGDGNVDAATVTFSEALSDATVAASEFDLGGTAADAFDTLATANDDTLQVRITTDANEVSGTGAVEVTHTTGATADAAGNVLGTVAAGDVSESDGAAPVVSGFSLTANDATDALDVSFDASESLATVSVSVSGPENTTLPAVAASGSTYSASTSVSTNGDYTATLDTATDAAGNGASASPSDTATVSFVATPTPTATPRADRDRGSLAPSALSGTGSKVRVSGTAGLSELGVSFDDGSAAAIRASGVSSLSGDVPPGTFVSAADITVPETFTETAATVKFAISRDRLDGLGVDPASLTMYRRHDGSWQALETRVVDRGGDVVVVEADTPGFSRFAVMAGGASAATTATASSSASTPDTTDESSDDAGEGAADADEESTGDASDATADESSPATTSSRTPGFGVVVALVALVAFLALGRRRD